MPEADGVTVGVVVLEQPAPMPARSNKIQRIQPI
jgi:hypothetical protein